MKKSKKILMAGLVVLLIISVFVISSYSPAIAIRKHLFLLNPIKSLTCKIQPTARGNFKYGNEYIISGFYDKLSGGKVYLAYVKRNILGLYYWTGDGSEK